MTVFRSLGIVLLFVASGCGTREARFDALAARAGLSRAVIAGDHFAHVIYVAADDPDTAAPVWIYIEGDGTPWIDQVIPAPDPTPRTPVALPAMIDGPRPAVFLGRPCYFGAATVAAPTTADSLCGPIWWTHRRFAPEVVASMIGALERTIAGRGWATRRINLVGYSGGGTLAVLMAPHVKRLCAVVTLASPLDLGEWTLAHGYSPLQGSVDPAASPPLPATARQLHLRGARDRIVDPASGAEFRRHNPQAEFRTLPDLAHGDEWIGAWQRVLASPELHGLVQCR